MEMDIQGNEIGKELIAGMDNPSSEPQAQSATSLAAETPRQSFSSPQGKPEVCTQVRNTSNSRFDPPKSPFLRGTLRLLTVPHTCNKRYKRDYKNGLENCFILL